MKNLIVSMHAACLIYLSDSEVHVIRCKAIVLVKDFAMSLLGACRCPCMLKFRSTEFMDSHLAQEISKNNYIINVNYSINT